MSIGGCTSPHNSGLVRASVDGGVGGKGNNTGGGAGAGNNTGGGTGAGALALDASAHDFGAVVVGSTSADGTFIVNNGGGATSGALAVTLTGAAAGFKIKTDGCTGMMLAASATCRVVVTVTPLAAGALTGTFTVTAQPGGSVTATLTAAALSPGALQIDPKTQDFGSAVQNRGTATQSFTVTNPGPQSSGAIAVTLGGTDALQFQLAVEGCTGKILAASGTCQVAVRFGATALGAKAASLTVAANPGGTTVAQLSGTGITAGTVALAPDAHDYGTIQQGKTGTPQVFTVTNLGQAATGPLTATLLGTDGTQFSITATSCQNQTLAAMGTCSVTVQFAPSTPGSRLATLSVSGTPGGTALSQLSGVSLSNPMLTVAPASKDFNSVTVGSNAGAAFVVSNTGGVATGIPAVTLAGTDVSQFSIPAGSNTCTAALPASGGSCAITVRFAPTATGLKNASLTVTAAPGGSAAAALVGTGSSPGAITLGPSSQAFGALVPGAVSATTTFTVTNSGGSPTGALSASVLGSTEFVIVNDPCSTTALAPAATCTLTARFAPTSPGPKSGTLQVTATPGGVASAGLTGTGQRPAALSASSQLANLGNVEVGTTATTSVIVTNLGDVATSTPTLMNSDPAELSVVTNGCAAAIAAGASCTIALGFKPSTGGTRSGSITLSISGSAVTFTVAASGAYRLTITKAGTGTGTVNTNPAGVSCGTTCSFLFAAGASVIVQARTTNGSSSFFSGYAGAGCAGPARDCAIVVSAPTTVTATFSPMTSNLIFVTAAGFPSDRGRASLYDTDCNTAANAAGINDAGGMSYVAMISDAASLGLTRLGPSANGWVRMDGLPFADTQVSLFTRKVVFNPIYYDETGNPSPVNFTKTGTFSDGTLANLTCANWTSALSTDAQFVGHTQGGAAAWVATEPLGGCNFPLPLLCMGKTRNTTVAPVVTAGRKIWVSNSVLTVGGGMTPDQLCQSQLPAGVTAAAAFIATTTRTAASLLGMTMRYVRPDGTLVGTGALLASGQTLLSGIWQSGNLLYGNPGNGVVWTGAASPTSLGTAASTCGNWIDATQTMGKWGIYTLAETNWWGQQISECTQLFPIYCVQTAP